MICCDRRCGDEHCNKDSCIYDTAMITCANVGCNKQVRYPVNNYRIPIYCFDHMSDRNRRGHPIFRNGNMKKSTIQEEL